MRAGDADQDERTVLDHVHGVHLHLRALLVGVVIRERLEVQPADEARRAAAHGLDVESLAHPPHEGLREGGPPPADLVDVAACDGVVSRVEAMTDGPHVEHVDVGGQGLVQPRQQRRRRQRGRHVEVRDLAEGMDAGVGSPRAVDLEAIAPARDLLDRLDEIALHRAGVALHLPARIPGAVVLEQEAEARHDGAYERGAAPSEARPIS